MKPIIPTPLSQVHVGINKLIEKRPGARRHVYDGRYGDIFAGRQAQARLNRNRLADEAMQVRLPLASGDGLRDLARSEYWAEWDETPGSAIGEVFIFRQVTNNLNTGSGNFNTGVIPAGTRFRREAKAEATPPVTESTYTSTTTIVVDNVENFALVDNGDGTFTHFQFVTIPVVASETGPGPNTPAFNGESNTLVDFVDPLFDPLFSVVSFLAAGGFTRLEDETVRKLAQANYLGQFGPTNGALIASTLKHFGVQHVAPILDPVTAVEWLFMADESWACSRGLLATAQTIVKKEACGFGCRIAGGFVVNGRITVRATVILADASEVAATSDKSDITKAVAKKLRAYFDDRPDWYTWKLQSVGATIAAAHPKIIACPTVQVLDRIGVAVPEPPTTINPSTQPVAIHYYLVDDAVNLTFQGAD